MVEKKLTRKELLKSPDEFMTIAERVIQYVTLNRKKVVTVAIAAVVVVLAYLGFRWYLANRHDQAMTAFNQAVAKVPADLTKTDDVKAAVTALEAVVNDYSARPAENAWLYLGHLYYALGEWDKSEAAYNKFLGVLPADDQATRAVVYSSLAYVYEAKGAFEPAIAKWQEILGMSGDLLHEEAYLAMGRLYEEQGEKAKATQAYKDLLEKYPQSQYLALAKAQLTTLGAE